MEQLKKQFNAINKEIANLKKVTYSTHSFKNLNLNQEKKDASELQEKSKTTKSKIKEAEEKALETESQRDKTLNQIGNIIHDSVPISQDEVLIITIY